MQKKNKFTDVFFYTDLASFIVASILICLFSHRLILMTVLIPLLMILRTYYVTLRFNKEETIQEIIFLSICIVIGGFNDWNSVCNKNIYSYGVPTFFPKITTIPLWMLFYWGLILRLITSLAFWSKIETQNTYSNKVRFFGDNAWFKVLFQLLLVFITRQLIYINYLDPFLSWIFFAIAFVVYLIFIPLKKADILLLTSFAIGGPITEVLYIKIGNLHHYHHGVFFGVPIWIILWWIISVLLWKDISCRLIHLISSIYSGDKNRSLLATK